MPTKREKHEMQDNNALSTIVSFSRSYAFYLREKKTGIRVAVASYWNGDLGSLSPLLKDNTLGALFMGTWITAFLLLNACAKNLVINTTAGHEVIPDAPSELREGKNVILARIQTRNLREYLTKDFIGI